MRPDPSMPPGWRINPSGVQHRSPLVMLAALGLLLALVNVLHAHGIIARLWEPFPAITPQGWVVVAPPFPHPEIDVIGFGALLLFSVLGSSERWRTRPLLAVMCGTAAFVTATTALVRWTEQYASSGTTSTIACALTAVAVAAAPFSLDELVAALYREGELHHVRRQGRPYRVTDADSRPEEVDGGRYVAGVGAIMVGVVLLVVANSLASTATLHARVAGSIVAAVGALSLPRVSRPLRWINAGIGAWLMLSPLLFGYRVRATLYFVILGLLLMSVSIALGDDRRTRAASQAH